MRRKYLTHLKKPFQRLFAVVLTLVCLFGSSFQANALLISNGTGSSGGSGNNSVTGSGSYGLPAFVDDEYINAPAYRFTVVSSAGTQKTTSVDIYKAAYSKYAGTAYHKTKTKYPKTLLKSVYTTATLNTEAVNDACYIDSDLGLSLPADTTEMYDSWSVYTDYINTLMGAMWNNDTTYLSDNNYYLLIEPIYPVKLEGQYHSLTVTEMAVYGAYKFGADTVPPSSGEQNSWAWISNYTNKLYPNALRQKADEAGLTAASELTARASFKTIIENGYGAMTVSAEDLGATETGDPPEIVRWAYEQVNVEYTSATYHGFYVYLQVENADTVKIPTWTILNGQDDLIWYDAVKLAKEYNGIWYNYVRFIPFSEHNDEVGTYATHFYAYNDYGNLIFNNSVAYRVFIFLSSKTPQWC